MNTFCIFNFGKIESIKVTILTSGEMESKWVPVLSNILYNIPNSIIKIIIEYVISEYPKQQWSEYKTPNSISGTPLQAVICNLCEQRLFVNIIEFPSEKFNFGSYSFVNYECFQCRPHMWCNYPKKIDSICRQRNVCGLCKLKICNCDVAYSIRPSKLVLCKICANKNYPSYFSRFWNCTYI